MTIPRVRWSKKQRQYIPGVVRLTESGIPIDARDWDAEDWADLHEAITTAVKKISERHKERTNE